MSTVGAVPIDFNFTFPRPPNMDPSSAVLHLCAFLNTTPSSSDCVFRLAGKYFQIAAFVMLAYDHGKLALLNV